MEWNSVIGKLAGQTKQKIQALEHLQGYVESNAVHKDQVSTLLDMSGQLLSDNNFKVALKLLTCWEVIAANNGDVIRTYVSALLPPVVERLSDNHQEVRQAACNLLLELLQAQRPDVMMEKLGRFWAHKHWKVRHGLLQFVAEAVSTTGEAVLVMPREEADWVLHKVIQLVGDPESAVRDAAIECLEEVYKVYGEQLVDIISGHNLRPAHLNAIYARLAQMGADVAPALSTSTGYTDQSPQGSRQHNQHQHSHHHGMHHATGQEEHDTACSAGDYNTAGSAACEHDGGYAVGDDDEGQEQEGMVSSHLAHGEHCHTAARRQQQQPALAAEDSSCLTDASRSWGTASAAVIAAGGGTRKRGGYKDGGGITSDGVLPQAQPIYVASERELKIELERVFGTLSCGAAMVDWQKRVAALMRLEGIVRAGAVSSFEVAFMEALQQLRDPLLEQLIDRRSAVARQAAHLMEVLAAALGPRFEPYCTAFMGALFKALVITVQVVSEAADSAAKGIVHHCHAPRLVPFVCDIVAKDKNAKLRQHCSALLLQILEDWEPQEYTRSIDSIEAGLVAAVQDALADTRTAGRAAFAVFSNVMPERAAALLRRLDNSLQQKLHQALLQHNTRDSGGALGSARGGATSHQATRQPAGRPGRAAAAPAESDMCSMGPPPAAAKPPRSGRMGGVYQRAVLQPAPAAAPQPAAAAAAATSHSYVVDAPSRPGRKSVAGMPMRVPGPGIADSTVALPAAVSATAAAAVGDGAAAIAAAAAGGGGRRRTSVLPQRVPYPELPNAPAAAAGIAVGSKASLAAEAAKIALPNTPDSCDTSEAPAGDARLAASDHASITTRLFQQPKLVPVQQQQQLYRAPSSSTDDLQLQSNLRDQQQQQMQLQYQQQQHYHYQQQQQYQDQLAVQPSSSSVAGGLPAAIAGLAGLQQQQQRPATLAKAVAGVMANSKDWKERVEKMNLLAEALTRQADANAPAESYSELEKALPKLMAAADDAHFKVSLAALAALQVCLNTAPHSLEGSLDKLMPLLFLKLCGAKQSVRSAAEGALQACALHLDADSLLPALIRSLEAMKQPAARVSVMEFAVLFLGEGKVAGVPTTATHVKQWVSKNIPLLLDKNPNVRQMACKALGTMYNIDPNSVAGCLQHASAQEVIAVQRSLADAEARAAEEEHERAAVHGGTAMLEQPGLSTWAAHRSTWGTGDRGAASTSSSMDLSTTAAPGGSGAAGSGGGSGSGSSSAEAAAGAAVCGLPAGMAELAVGGGWEQGSRPPAPRGHGTYRQPAATAAGSASAAAGLSEVHPGLHRYHHQQQQQEEEEEHHHRHHLRHTHQQQQQHASPELPGSSGVNADGMAVAAGCDVTGAGAAAAVPVGGGMDVLGRPVSTAHSGTVQALASSSGAAAGVAAAGAAGRESRLPLAPVAAEQISGAAAAAAAAAAAGDAGSQARHLTVLVHRLQSKPGEEVLAELAACAGTMCRQAWQDNFSKVLLAGLSAAQHSHEPIRELAFMLVLALAKHQGDLFEPVLDVVVQPLLQGCADESREVLMAAQQALDVLMTVMPPLRCADILAHKLPSEEAVSSGTAVDGEVLCATIHCLQLVCRHVAPADLLAVAPHQLLPGLFAAFQHSRPDVRKAVVFCLVEMWHTAGDGLTPHLAALSTSQLKLLTIYFNRTQPSSKQHAEEEEGTH